MVRAYAKQRCLIFCKSFAAALFLLALAAGFLYLCYIGEAKTGSDSLYSAVSSGVEAFYDGQALQAFSSVSQSDAAEKYPLIQQLLEWCGQEGNR